MFRRVHVFRLKIRLFAVLGALSALAVFAGNTKTW
jgi:hypothetical protein